MKSRGIFQLGWSVLNLVLHLFHKSLKLPHLSSEHENYFVISALLWHLHFVHLHENHLPLSSSETFMLSSCSSMIHQPLWLVCSVLELCAAEGMSATWWGGRALPFFMWPSMAEAKSIILTGLHLGWSFCDLTWKCITWVQVVWGVVGIGNRLRNWLQFVISWTS